MSLVAYDSGVAIGAAAAVYVTALAQPVDDTDLARAADVFSSRVPQVSGYGPEQLRAPAPLRLYRATVQQSWILLRGGDPRNTTGIDTRVPVTLTR